MSEHHGTLQYKYSVQAIIMIFFLQDEPSLSRVSTLYCKLPYKLSTTSKGFVFNIYMFFGMVFRVSVPVAIFSLVPIFCLVYGTLLPVILSRFLIVHVVEAELPCP